MEVDFIRREPRCVCPRLQHASGHLHWQCLVRADPVHQRLSRSPPVVGSQHKLPATIAPREDRSLLYWPLDLGLQRKHRMEGIRLPLHGWGPGFRLSRHCRGPSSHPMQISPQALPSQKLVWRLRRVHKVPASAGSRSTAPRASACRCKAGARARTRYNGLRRCCT